MIADWLIVLRLGLCLCLCQHVLTGHYSDAYISISIRRAQGFDILMLTLMSWPSSQAHKSLHAYIYAYVCVASEDRALMIHK